ncbi:hypothetical protein A8135_07635 [Legionella jamestowniensis]|uniref:Uncharacterized protein n=1 Tax=Legionella jamestowniensis TaxID=455 RepID=A0ABX2Y2Q6_9GAMM|nr:hypothetical protein [Legionella jamestowniensis]OCH99541.1 hypothetical protein A8135_07635 [Legionella jamestowniensis]
MLKAFGGMVNYTTSFFKADPIPPSVKLDTSIAFDYRNSSHVDIIKNRVLRFKQAQAALFHYDNQIIGALAVSVASWTGGVLPLPLPLWTISLASCSYGCYRLGNRTNSGLTAQYREALNDLLDVYKWSMSNKTHTWYKLGILQIQEMITTLGPWAKKDTLVVWEDSDLVAGKFTSRGVEPSEEFKTKLKEFTEGLPSKSVWFSVYGEEGTDDLIPAVNAYLKELAVGTAKKCAPEAVTTFLKLQ